MTVEVLKPDFRRNTGQGPHQHGDGSVTIEIEGRSFQVTDLSVDGNAVVEFDGSAEVGQTLQTTLTFPFEGCNFSVPVACEVTSFQPDKSQLGLHFRHTDDGTQRELLSSIFRAVAMGERVSASDVLQAAQLREQGGAPAAASGTNGGEGIRRRLGAIAFVVLAGSLATFIAANLATRAYVVEADGAIVNPQSRIERMPVAAELVSYTVPIGARVPANATIAMVRTKAGQLLPVNSTCNCVVGGQLATSPVFLNKGEPIAQLVPAEGTNHAVLGIKLEDMRRIRVGDKVTASFYDSSAPVVGMVERVSAPKLIGGLTGKAAELAGTIEVRFATKLPAWRVGEPVNARITLSKFNPLA